MSRTVVKPEEFTDDEWPCDVAALTPEQKASAIVGAQTWLWSLSGRRVGAFTTVEDRYEPSCSDACGAPYKDSEGRWRNGSRDASLCCRILLDRQPVRAVTAVRLGGVVLDPAEYVVEGSWLIRLGACWPCGDECEASPIEVDYEWGVPFGDLGRQAIGEVACEFAKGLTGQACKIPSRAIQVSRQGVTIDMDDASQFAENGLTGMPIADAWIRTVNPARLAQRSRVVSVDAARVR